MSVLKNKRILYIGVSTFSYEKEIKSSLEKLGAIVDYYDERPANDFLTKVLLRLNLKKLIQSKIDSYYSRILDETKDMEYDYVFIIKLETIDRKILDKLKNHKKNATFILYLWDSIQNYKGKEKLLSYFDRAFTFDSNDAEKFSYFYFLPLFYIPAYANTPDTSASIKNDLCFIGSGHGDRYQLVKKIEKEAEKVGLKTYSFFYLQSKLIFIFRRIFDKRLRFAHISEFSFTSLTQEQVLEKILESNVIIDIEHQGQVGLTMRTIEMIGCQKKLLTTNQSIKSYDFYSKENIFLIDRHNPSLNLDFFKTSYQKIDIKTYDKYSIENWLKTIFL